jgi:hypothetical protein
MVPVYIYSKNGRNNRRFRPFYIIQRFDIYAEGVMPSPARTARRTEAAMTEPICPPVFAPIACHKRKLLGLAF